jgi:ubiquitin carboxyl-terminal hydrolase 34
MCLLSDKDLRLAGTKNTTELMYNAFKDVFDVQLYALDEDGLRLALKYFVCSTLTIRLCGIAQMNVISLVCVGSPRSPLNPFPIQNQISLWNELNGNKPTKTINELANWFIDNRIIEHLFGPNLHVEVCVGLPAPSPSTSPLCSSRQGHQKEPRHLKLPGLYKSNH